MKLPVFRTFSHALGFAFTNFATCFRLAWLPLTLLFAVQQVFEWYVFDFAKNRMEFVPGTHHVAPNRMIELFAELFQQFASLQGGLILLQSLVTAAVAVSIHRVVLFGDRREGSVINFAFGKTEFLYMIMAAMMAFIILSLLASVMLPAVMLVAGGDLPAFIAQFKNFPDNIKEMVRSGQIGVLAIGYVVAWLLVIFVSIRLAIWPPSVVATGSLSPSDSWQLMRGNVFRFIGLVILSAIVAWIIIGGVTFAVMANGGLEAMRSLQTLDHQNPMEMQQHMRESMLPYLPIIFIVGLMVYVFILSYVVALISYSYKALKGYDAVSPIPA